MHSFALSCMIIICTYRTTDFLISMKLRNYTSRNRYLYYSNVQSILGIKQISMIQKKEIAVMSCLFANIKICASFCLFHDQIVRDKNYRFLNN